MIVLLLRELKIEKVPSRQYSASSHAVQNAERTTYTEVHMSMSLQRDALTCQMQSKNYKNVVMFIYQTKKTPILSKLFLSTLKRS